MALLRLVKDRALILGRGAYFFLCYKWIPPSQSVFEEDLISLKKLCCHMEITVDISKKTTFL